MLPAGMKMIGQTGGIFEMAESLCGYSNLCLLLADDRELVHAIFERIGWIYEAMYTGMAMLPEVGALVISDDLGFKTQTLISPADIRKHVNLLMTGIGKTGRYALGSGNSIADYVPVEKYLTMLDEGWRWRVM